MIADTQDDFLLCWPFVLAEEAPFPDDWSNPRNFSNDPHDPGGETMDGIIQREYSAYRISKGEPSRDVILITKPEGADIYRNSYWLPNCPKLPRGFNLCVFDENVNAGPHAGTVLLQRTLGIPADGLWGPQTDAAVATITDVTAAIEKYTDQREAYYRSLRGFQYFGTGWLRRSATIETAALKMAA